MQVNQDNAKIESISIQPEGIEGFLGLPERPRGAVVFAHGSGSGRMSPRNNHVAAGLKEAGFVTLLIDLLTPAEELDRANVFDVRLLALRLTKAKQWMTEIRQHPLCRWAISAPAPAPLLRSLRSPCEITR